MKTEKNRKLQGSVLFTVVFVMSILIVLLFGTLALANASNSRAHVNYSSAQGGITARTFTDAAITALGGKSTANKPYKEAIASLNKVNVEDDGGTRSYSAFVDYEGADATKLGSLGRYYDEEGNQHAGRVDIEYVEQRTYFDTDKNEWFPRDVLKFTSEVEVGGVTKSATAYVMKHQEGDTTTNTGNGAGFVSRAGTNLTCQTSVFGGTYVELPRWTITGDEATKDYYKNISYGGEPFKSTNTGTWLEADVYVCNDMYLKNFSGFIFPELGKGVTIWGDFTADDSQCSHAYASNINVTADQSIDFADIPYLFVNGKITWRCEGTIGLADESDNQLPFNIFCGEFDSRNNNSNKFDVRGDIYCMDEGKKNYIVGESGQITKLHDWVGHWNDPTGATGRDSGSIYSKSDVYLENITIDGGVYVDGTLEIKGNVTINGDVVAKHIQGIDNPSISFGESSTVYYNSSSDINLGDKASSGEFIGRPSYVHRDSFPDGIDESEYVVVDNKVNYYEFTITRQTDDWQALRGAKGEALSYSEYQQGNTVYYEFINDERPPEGASESELGNFLGACHKTIEGPAIEEMYYDVASGTIVGTGRKATTGRYIVKKSDGSIFTWKSRARKDGSDSGEATDKDTTWYKNDGGDDPIDESQVTGAHTYNEYGTAYPKYAEKMVLLGLETVTGVPKENTKVIKTIKEVVDKIGLYNYENATTIFSGDTFDGKYSDFTDTMKSPLLSSVAQIEEKMTGYVTTKSNFDRSKGLKSIDISTTGDKEPNTLLINESCRIGGLAIDGKNLIISPGNKDIIVIVDGTLNMMNGSKIIINDVGEGTVNFYLLGSDELAPVADEGEHQIGKLAFNADGSLMTTVRYDNKLFEPGITELQYKSGKSCFDIAELGPPRVNIYGGKESEITVSNSSYFVANILSSEIKTTFLAQANPFSFDHFYYKGFDLCNIEGKNWHFGSVTSGDINYANVFKIVFIEGNDGEDDGNGGNADNVFWYRILYYTEN